MASPSPTAGQLRWPPPEIGKLVAVGLDPFWWVGKDAEIKGLVLRNEFGIGQIDGP